MPARNAVPPLINDRYEVGETIGRGGMATVHVGRDLRLGRRVAIKVLRPELARDATFHERFKREAQSVAALNHHSIVSVYDTGEILARTDEGVDRPFIVMEYVPGRTLRELIHEDAVTPRDAVDITLGILDALEYSHRAGIVHRDIKPANVIVTPERQVKVMDFGIARAVEDTSPALTQAQAVLGTAQYLSPEQARGESVDARSDLYSAACVLFEMLTGRAPFVGESSVDIAAQHVRDHPPAPSELDPRIGHRVDEFMAQALDKDREARFQDAGQMRRALRELRPAVPEDLEATQSLRAVPGPEEDTKTLPPVPVPVPAAAPPAVAPGTAAGIAAATPGDAGHGSVPVRRRRPLRTALLALLVVALLAVLGVVALQWVQGQRGGPALVAVPYVAGMDASVAETAGRRAAPTWCPSARRSTTTKCPRATWWAPTPRPTPRSRRAPRSSSRSPGDLPRWRCRTTSPAAPRRRPGRPWSRRGSRSGPPARRTARGCPRARWSPPTPPAGPPSRAGPRWSSSCPRGG